KRRLRALSAERLPDHGRPGPDYVWIAKRGAVSAPVGKLRRDGERALRALTGTKEPEAATGAPKP
ncbi:MAG: ribonuclease P protein component, partial [Pseudomonadota bacterium]|nr:ribonuclease P protein component [Pseudomonadota bacterium]